MFGASAVSVEERRYVVARAAGGYIAVDLIDEKDARANRSVLYLRVDEIERVGCMLMAEARLARAADRRERRESRR